MPLLEPLLELHRTGLQCNITPGICEDSARSYSLFLEAIAIGLEAITISLHSAGVNKL